MSESVEPKADEPGYYDRVNRDLLRLIPPDAKRVIEIGCGTGRLAEAYRRINLGVEWIGVEINLDAAQEAERPERCSQVLGHDIEVNGVWFDVDFESADCILFGDVLEHLRWPQTVLRSTVKHLRPGGQVIACIPNVQHWTIIRNLLNGEWEYTDEGLMDRTHLRWFTAKSAVKLFADAGLHVFDMRGRMIGNDGIEEFRNIIDRRAMGEVAYAELMKHAKAYQYLVRGMKPIVKTVPYSEVSIDKMGWVSSREKEVVVGENPEPTRVLIRYLVGCGACAHVRCIEPGQFLTTIPGVQVEIHAAETQEQVKALGDLDWEPSGFEHKVVILQRFHRMSKLAILALEDCGWTIIVELDDYPATEVDGLNQFLADDCRVLRQCHAIQTTTEPMRATLERLVPGQTVEVIPNQVAELPPFPEEKFMPSDRKVRVFFGAINRKSDWLPLMPELNRLAKERDDITFVVVHDLDFYQALESSNKEFHPYLAYPAYREVLRSCDIALLPLEDTEFNRHKSDLKFLECAAEGVVAVCSDNLYGDIADANGGFVLTSTRDFAEGIECLLESPELCQRLVRLAYAYVRDNRLLSQHYRKLYEFYRGVSERHASGELSTALQPSEPEPQDQAVS